MISVPQKGEKLPISQTRLPKVGRFGRVPEYAYDLCEDGQLIGRDIQLLGWLMRRTAPGNPIVTERQPSLAQRFRCTVKTVQRALARLEQCGLLVRLYVRDALGRLHGRGYDLAATLALMPSKDGSTKSPISKSPISKATPVSDRAPRPGAADHARNGAKPARRQSDTDDQPKETRIVCQGDNSAGTIASDPPIVVDLVALGVFGATARSLARKRDVRIIQEVITAAQAKKRTNLAGWIVAALSSTHPWNLGPRTTTPKTANGRRESIPKPPTPLLDRERKRLKGGDLGVAELLDLCRRVGGFEAVLGEMERVIEWRERDGAAPAAHLAIYKRVLEHSVKAGTSKAEKTGG